MDNSKTPLPDNQDHIEGDDNLGSNTNIDDKDQSGDQGSQKVDLDNPMMHTFDDDDVIDNSAGFSNSEVGSRAVEGATPMHRQNVDEATIDNVLVQDNLDDADYPDIVDIADKDAAENSNKDDF